MTPAGTEAGRHGVVVVGGGQAAHQLATTLRRQGYADPIRILSEEPHAPYQRPPLSKQFLAGEVELDDLAFDTIETLESLRIELRLGERVTGLDLAARRVYSQDGASLEYDHLVLATGARNRTFPFRTPLGVHDVRDIADAIALRDDLRRATRVVVIGAGFLGIESACVAMSLGLPTEVIEMDHAMMARVLSSDASSRITRAHHQGGINVRFKSAVGAFVSGPDGRVRGVELTSGEHVAADLVICSIGVVPRVELAEDAGLAVDNGICVDRYLRTSAPDVYAVGDCAAFPWDASGRMVRIEAVSNAVDQADHVAATILGSGSVYQPKPWFWSHQGTARLQIAGLGLDVDQHVLAHGESETAFSVLGFSQGRLVTVETLNRPRDHMTGRRLIFSGDAPTFEAMKALDFDLARAIELQSAG